MSSIAETKWALLRQVLVSKYDDIGRALTRKLGSRDLAAEALQDTFVRIERGGELGEVHNPRAYLVRMAMNIATDRRRAANRFLSVSEGEALLNFMDDAPGPDRVAEGRSDIYALERALSGLPDRRRAVFESAWIEGCSHTEIAQRFGLALRTVQQELKLAREHCAAWLEAGE
ncbi:MAG TPA: RNA polymerase sigma factor [Rhizomicrobium sp.]|jgi:RNA polymerase sigma-70 factor (ECF subfamily)